MKKLTSLLLALVLLLATAAPISAAQPDAATPYYTSISRADVIFTINDEGLARWTIACVGASGTVAIDSVTYLEHKVGNRWVRVDLGNTNDEYTYNVSAPSLSKTYTKQLTTPGTYRAVVVFTVYRTEKDGKFIFWKEQVYEV